MPDALMRDWNAASWLVPAAILLLLLLPTRRVLGPITTIFHEFGHAFTGMLFGARVLGIRVSFDSSGEARLAHPPGPRRHIGRKMSLWAGYLTPPLTGLIMLTLTRLGHEPWPLITSGATGVTVLLFIRNWQGLATMLAYLAAIAAAAINWRGLGDEIISALAWLLLIGGILDLLRAGRIVFRNTAETDFHFLARESRLPFPPAAHYISYLIITAALIIGASTGIRTLTG